MLTPTKQEGIKVKDVREKKVLSKFDQGMFRKGSNLISWKGKKKKSHQPYYVSNTNYFLNYFLNYDIWDAGARNIDKRQSHRVSRVPVSHSMRRFHFLSKGIVF